MNLINYSIRKLNADKYEDSLITIKPDETMISSLTGDKYITCTTSSACCNSISSLNYYTTIENEAVNNPNEIEGNTTKSSICWPKGSTSSFHMDLNEQLELATKEAVKQLEAEQRKSRSKVQLSKGLLDIIIAATKDMREELMPEQWTIGQLQVMLR
jgi:hypothetical protein